VAERLERNAHRMFTRQVRRHDVEPDLRDRLWADGEIRAFWLSQARDVLDDIRADHAASLGICPNDREIAIGNRRCPVSDGKDTS
jgi:hypothetical protein